MTENGFSICKNWTSMHNIQANSQQDDEPTLTCCIKVDDCLTLYTRARKKKASAVTEFILNSIDKRGDLT